MLNDTHSKRTLDQLDRNNNQNITFTEEALSIESKKLDKTHHKKKKRLLLETPSSTTLMSLDCQNQIRFWFSRCKEWKHARRNGWNHKKHMILFTQEPMIWLKIVKNIRDTLPVQRPLTLALFWGKTDETLMNQGQISVPKFVIFTSNRILVLLIMEILMSHLEI